MIASGERNPYYLLLNHIKEFKGKTQYKLIKEISKRYKIATSTLKYSFKKLVRNNIIKYDKGVIDFDN